MRKKLIQKAIDKEIDWCKKNPIVTNHHKSYEYHTGFIEGLIQANRIIEKLANPPTGNDTRE